MSRTFRSWATWVAAFLSVCTVAQTKTYIALGDSVAFGFQPNDYSRGNGDKGYVRPVADWLGSRNGGVRPVLLNLGVPEETTGSFYDTSKVGALLNSNYPIIGRKSQAETFKAKVASELGKGHVIASVTFALGANDLLDLLTQQFLSLPFEQQQALADGALAVAKGNLDKEIALIRSLAPGCTLVVPGYYNPYGAFPGSPEDRIAEYAIPRLNQLLIVSAKRGKAFFAPNYAPFRGHELAYTWIGQNDVHPNDTGYGVIANSVQGSFATGLLSATTRN